MANFNEHALEMSIMELLKDEGYTYLNGRQIFKWISYSCLMNLIIRL